jgi:hypothetical protein
MSQTSTSDRDHRHNVSAILVGEGRSKKIERAFAHLRRSAESPQLIGCDIRATGPPIEQEAQ